MIDKGYTTSGKIESYLGKTITESLSHYILSAQKYIEQYTERNFKCLDEETTRLINGNGLRQLAIGDWASISKLEVSFDEFGDNFEEVLATNYKLTPNNYVLDNEPARFAIMRDNLFPKGFQNVKITGKYGFAEVPDDISFVATVLASGMYNAQKKDANLRSESIGQYSVSYGEKQWSDFEQVKGILQSYEVINI